VQVRRCFGHRVGRNRYPVCSVRCEPIDPLSSALIAALVRALLEDVRANRAVSAVPVLLGLVASGAGGIVYLVALRGDELGEFFSVAAQVSIGVLVGLAVDVTRGQSKDPLEAALQLIGFVTVLLGVVCALAGTLVSPHQEIATGILFGVAWGGVIAGFASLILIVGAKRQPSRTAEETQ
jgi:hypothetical protein